MQIFSKKLIRLARKKKLTPWENMKLERACEECNTKPCLERKCPLFHEYEGEPVGVKPERVEVEKKCLLCGNKFTTKDKRMKYCSNDCYLTSNKLNALIRYYERKSMQETKVKKRRTVTVVTKNLV